MHIIADENIPCVQSAFATLGQVRTVAGRHLTAADLAEAEILLVRSVTPVNEKLLAKSTVRFVGTATIGYDHIDLGYLQRRGIGFASAPGSNATAAAEYVISVLFALYPEGAFINKTVGIIGCGNVGSRVLHKLQALGVSCAVYDPPLAEKIACSDYNNLDAILSADIITLHVPLEKTGRYPTYQLVNADFLDQLSAQAMLINTARGDVIDEVALLNTLAKHPYRQAILDVWHGEPAINRALLQHIALGTPHIAGYSSDGKVQGTAMLYAAVCDYFGYTPTWQPAHCLAPPPLTSLTFSETVEDNYALCIAVMACYDVRRDDHRLRLITQADHPAIFFDNLRKHYPLRREFNCVKVELPATKTVLAEKLRGLGFQVVFLKK